MAAPPTRSRRRDPLRTLFARRNIIFSWAVLLVAMVHPPHGTGVSLCWLHSKSAVPCPGCGLTRSVSCAARGMWRESWDYHAFGLMLLAVFASIAVFGLAPARFRRTILRHLVQRRPLVRAMYIVLICAFVAYGLLRALGRVVS